MKVQRKRRVRRTSRQALKYGAKVAKRPHKRKAGRTGSIAHKQRAATLAEALRRWYETRRGEE